ncbi:MAG TPA: HAMP domain-containing sensor histidine kinase [Polyangia bacterium]|jgi:Signal transduction histidine kinase|nr:HAMP domain-containing sensor histidine kinase [Polyangia bacterium]
MTEPSSRKLAQGARDDADAPGFDEIEREEQSRLFGRIAWARVAVLPALVGVVIWLLATDETPWRRWVLGTLIVLASAFFLVEAGRHRGESFRRGTIRINLTFAVLAQAAAAFATGGLGSPILPVMFPVAMVVAITMRPPAPFLLVACQIVALWAMALAEVQGLVPNLNLVAFGGGSRAGWSDTHLFVNAALASGALLVVAGLGRIIRGAFDAMIRRALRARQDSVRAHAELSALSGEIAHELKNPLASVKGLAGLLAQDVVTGKSGERLAVLRREVDRMQGILEEFLNFSRPLVPVAAEKVDLDALCREVAALHEGMAHERGISIKVRGADTTALCDPRKIEQVLLNLVQNALEASPAGAMVEIEANHDSEGVQVRVLDRGPGVAAELGARVFEPGVTSKVQGSGLGLTIARALARQHGGDLELSARADGGCEALLRLPAA